MIDMLRALVKHYGIHPINGHIVQICSHDTEAFHTVVKTFAVKCKNVFILSLEPVLTELQACPALLLFTEVSCANCGLSEQLCSLWSSCSGVPSESELPLLSVDA